VRSRGEPELIEESSAKRAMALGYRGAFADNAVGERNPAIGTFTDPLRC
jgi:hypothetical protein